MTGHEWKGEGGPADQMMLRDWLAGQALVGILAFSHPDNTSDQLDPDDAAEGAYQMADAMLAARKPKAGPEPRPNFEQAESAA